MTAQEKTQSAREMGLMEGFPPPPEKRVTRENQMVAPFNRWSFRNELRLNRTADVRRGEEAVAQFQANPRDLNLVTYKNMAGSEFTFKDMIELSYTDGILVLHQGKVIYEQYLNDMKPYSLHAWASGSKSMTGTLAALLAYKGLFDVDAQITTYLPKLKSSGFGDATIQQIMDMTTSIGFPEDRADPISENWRYGVVMGWVEKPDGYKGVETIYDFLPTMKKTGEHGSRFAYLTPNTDVLAWLLKQLTQQSLAELMHEHIWSKLGTERDAYWIVDPFSVETSGSGLVTTLRDMARFGQMMLQKGFYNGRQILPSAVVEDIERGADQEDFARGPAASPGNHGYSYHNQWWVTHNHYGAYLAMGYGGQILYIAPQAEMVVAKFSSYPTPTPAGNEFYSAFAALPALAKMLMD
jgi:CubicO group peptidase (beta-lactamase class C family)